MKKSIVLLNNFNYEFEEQELLEQQKLFPTPDFLITTCKGTIDFNRSNLELRSNDKVISWLLIRFPRDCWLASFDSDKEIPIIQIEEGTSRECFSVRKK